MIILWRYIEEAGTGKLLTVHIQGSGKEALLELFNISEAVKQAGLVLFQSAYK